VAQPSQSCSGTVEFPIAVVFVVSMFPSLPPSPTLPLNLMLKYAVGVILALVVVAVIVFVKNRRISAQYSRLKQQSDHTLENETL
jgi:uncharacterized membrane protein YgaE (UPF0421/DUF939 family)